MSVPETLTTDEVSNLLKTANVRYPTGHRDKVLMAVMVNAGLRANEALSLRWKHVDLNTGKLIVYKGKGGKSRQVWIGGPLLDLFRSWRERCPSPDLVFPTLKGTKMWDSALRAMIKRRGMKAGIGDHVHPHMLRHTYATEYYRQTHDLRGLQENLGHAFLSTTQIYTHVADEDRERRAKAFSIGLK